MAASRERRESARVGRPTLHPKRLRSHRVVVRLRPDELAVIEQLAAEAELPLTVLVRQLLLTQRSPAPRPALAADVLHELRRQGNNLNQLLRAIHTRSAPLALLPAVHEILALYRALRSLLDGKEPRA